MERHLGRCHREALRDGMAAELSYHVDMVVRPDGSVAAATASAADGRPQRACVASELLALSLPAFEAPAPVRVSAAVTVPVSLATIGVGSVGGQRSCGGGVDLPTEQCASGEPAPAALAREVGRFLHRTAAGNSWSHSEGADYVRARDIEARIGDRSDARMVVRAAYRHRRGGYHDTRGCGAPGHPCLAPPRGEGDHCVELLFVPDGAGWELEVPSCVPGLGRTDFRPRRIRLD